MNTRSLVYCASWVIASCLFTVQADEKPQPHRRVIHISVDGLNTTLLAQLLDVDSQGRCANFKRLITEGASTLNARTDLTQTDTLPNHTCMITGRPVHGPEGWDETRHHGYTNNKDPGPKDTLSSTGNTRAGYMAGVFDVVHDHGLATALYASKSKFVIYTQSYNGENGAEDETGPDNGRNKIDRDVIEQTAGSNRSIGSRGMHEAFLSDLAAKRFDYMFVHYREPDSAGHGAGWGSDAWKNAVYAVDGYLGDILRVVDADEHLKRQTVMILTSDHGGETGNKSHFKNDDPNNYTIAFMVWGSGVTAGADLYEINQGSRQDPGTGRPDYNATLQPIRNGDSGNLALHLLGLPPISGSSINMKQDLRVSK